MRGVLAWALLVLATLSARAEEKLRVDADGEPLPPGAIVRLGTTRFRRGGMPTGVAFLDANTLVSSGSDGFLRVWHAPDGRQLRAIDGVNWGLALHDTTSGKELFYFEPTWEGYSVVLSPDRRLIATEGRTICVYSPRGPERLLALHVQGERWVAWTGDGWYAASWDGDLPVGRFLDHGPHALAEFVPLNHLKDRNRPDLIRRVLNAGSLREALREAAAVRK
jgi:WD40 repeat protein